ncbi:hypothetical protein J3E68DRAFT_391145 [Trichoderma sp. SZMC 28012]
MCVISLHSLLFVFTELVWSSYQVDHHSLSIQRVIAEVMQAFTFHGRRCVQKLVSCCLPDQSGGLNYRVPNIIVSNGNIFA